MQKFIALALIAVGALALTACHSNDENPEYLTWVGAGAPRAYKAPSHVFIAGTYVAHENTRYSRVTDTLMITKRKNTGSIYDITRYTWFQCRLLDKTIETKRNTQRLNGSFDDKTNLLFVVGKDSRMRIFPREHAVEWQGISFRKIE